MTKYLRINDFLLSAPRDAILLFDLDNTLYDENFFLFSVFEEIASILSVEHLVDSRSNISFFLKTQFLTFGRTGLLNKLISRYDLDISLINQFLEVYRSHFAELRLFPEYEDFDFSGSILITNGNIRQQLNKIKSLGLDSRFMKIFTLEGENKKPSPWVKGELRLNADQIPYYIGDSSTDFVFSRNSGFHYMFHNFYRNSNGYIIEESREYELQF